MVPSGTCVYCCLPSMLVLQPFSTSYTQDLWHYQQREREGCGVRGIVERASKPKVFMIAFSMGLCGLGNLDLTHLSSL